MYNDKTELISSEALPQEQVDTDNFEGISASRLKEIGVDLKDRLDTLLELDDVARLKSDNAEALLEYLMVEKDRPLPYEGYPNLTCPFTRIGVDSLHAQTMYALFGNDKKAYVSPEYISQAFVHTADKGAHFLSHVLNNESGLYSAVDDADRNDKLFGDGYLEPRYVCEKANEIRKVEYEAEVPDQEVVVINPETGLPEVQQTTKKVKRTRREKETRTIFEGVKVESIPTENIIRSPFIPRFEDAVKNDVVFKLFERTLKQIKRMAKGDDPVFLPSQVKQLESGVRKHVEDKLKKMEQARQKYDGYTLDYLCDKEMPQLAEAHCWLDVDGDDVDEKVAVTFEVSTGIVLRVALAPCRIVNLRSRPVNGRGYGERIYSVSRPFAKEWEAIHNGRVSKSDWGNGTFFFYRSGGRFNPQEIQLRPKTGYPVDSPQDVFFPQMPQPAPASYQEEQLLFNYLERVLGLNENMQGISGKYVNSATESVNISRNASIRLSNPLTRTVIALDELVGHIWDLNKECAPQTKEFAITGSSKVPLFNKMSKEDYNIQVKFKLNIKTVFDEQMLRDTMLLKYRMFSVNPIVMQHPAALYTLTQDTAKAMDGKELEIPKPPQAKALSPLEEHELFQMGEMPEPVVGEDVEDHLRQHKAMVTSEEFKNWKPEWQQELLVHIDKTRLMQQAMDAANLNQSGMFVPPPAMTDTPRQPGVTLSRNPTQEFNSTRVGETSTSELNNAAMGNE